MIKKLDKSVVLVPTILVLIIGLLITLFPAASTTVIETLRNLLGNEFGWYYLTFGLAILGVMFYMAFSKIGKIKLGKDDDKPVNLFAWGAMIFTATMAADILFYAFHEWTYYFNSSFLEQSPTTDSQKVLWSSSYSLFHWGLIPWSFYLVLAAIYGFMFFKSGRRDKQKLSEACRPLLGKHSDRVAGKTINIVAIVSLIAGTSTTFSITAPLMTGIILKLFNIPYSDIIPVLLLVIIAGMYAASVLTKKGIENVAKITTILYSFLIALFFVLGDSRFIIETGLQGLGNMLQNFFAMSTWTDPLRASNGGGTATGFPQDWTIFYWAYWIAWAVATPFFIARISKGRTIKQVLIGGGIAGLLGTFASFIVLGGFGMHLQTTGGFDAIAMMNEGASAAEMIIAMIGAMNGSTAILILLLVVMLGLYASTFDSITLVMSAFSYKKLDIDENPAKRVKVYWVVVFIILPIALVFLETTTQLLMSLAIIGAFPMTIIMTLTIISFFKELKQKKVLKNEKQQ